MRERGSGVILLFGGEGPPPREGYLGGLQVAFHALEAMRRQLATELGRNGIRVVTLRTGGVPESLPEDFGGRDTVADMTARQTLLGRAATLDDVGAVAAFVASDRARTMTAATVNVSAGALLD
jgi:enoyl-[acyl-carrier-protein] reductase (NADH)